jgi:transposase
MLPPGAQVFLATGLVDGRKGINGLSALVRSQFERDPLSGHLFVFFSRRADQVRVLYWDRDGYVLTAKRLEIGRFRVPWRAEHGHITLEAAELLLVLEGIDLTHAKHRKRWSPKKAPHEKKND